MNVKTTSLLGLLVLLLSACSPTLTPFTQRLYEQYRWTESELKQIQFYLSDNIVMRRELTGSKSEIISGEIKLIDGRKVEEIVIPSGTPGIFLFSPKDNRFAISFEEGGDERFLMFGPNPKANDRYVLLASDWDRRNGKVTYAGTKYLVDTNSAFAGLMVDLKKSSQISINRRTARGRTVN